MQGIWCLEPVNHNVIIYPVRNIALKLRGHTRPVSRKVFKYAGVDRR
jgi:hypothetical protein